MINNTNKRNCCYFTIEKQSGNIMVILTEAQPVSIFFFNNIIVLALKIPKKYQFFQNFQSFFSYRQITLPINFHGAEDQMRWTLLFFFSKIRVLD